MGIGCRDCIEAHGFKGDDTMPRFEAHDQEEDLATCGWFRAIFMWAMFVLTLWGYYLEQLGGLSHAVSLVLEILGILCWIGIIWSLVEYFGSGSQSGIPLPHASTGASISNLI